MHRLRAELRGVLLAVEKHVSLHPVRVRALRPHAVVAQANLRVQSIEQARLARLRRGRASHECRPIRPVALIRHESPQAPDRIRNLAPVVG